MADVLAPNLNNAGPGGAAAPGGAGQAAAAAAAAGRGQSSLLSGRRLLIYGLASTTAAAIVTFNAFRQRSNYYAAAVWLGRSNGCMLILLNFGIFMAIMYALAVQYIFFGPLRPIEVEHLHERAWYALTESLLAMTIFRDEFDVKFVIMFGTLLFLKIFHWLSEDRVDYMEQTPSVSILFHLRMISMLATMGAIDLCLVAWSLEAVVLDSKQLGLTIMFSTEFMVLLASNIAITAKYGINCIDSASQEVWEQKSMYVFYVDLVTDFLKLVVYTFFFIFILTTYGFPFNLVRDVVFTARSFFGRVRDLIRYRKATRNMDERYPNASVADVQALSDATCIICRDDMVVAGGPGVPAGQPSAQETPKKLPCGHIFHFHCLRSWLERQQSCPTCRRTVLQQDTNAAPGQAPRPENGAAAAAAAGEGGARPAPPQPGARPAAGPAPRATGTATAAGPTAAAAAPTRTSGRFSASRSATRGASGSRTAATRTTATSAGSPRPDNWTVESGLEAIRNGLERVRTEADRRRAEHASSSSRPEENSSAPSPTSAAQAQRDRDAGDLDRIPLALLEVLFQSTLGGERAIGDLAPRARGEGEGGVREVVLPLAHASSGAAVERSAWMPPRPEDLPVLQSTTELPEDRAAAAAEASSVASGSTAVRTEFVRSGAPSPSTASAVPSENAAAEAAAESSEAGAAAEEQEQEGGGGSADPVDPRQAVREAALRRFGGPTISVTAPTSSGAAATDASATPTQSDFGKGKEKERAPGDAPPASSAPAAAAAAATHPGNPRLTPLSSHTDLQTLAAELPFPLASGSAATLVPPALSDASVRERLATLERLQGVIADAVGELRGLLRPVEGAKEAEAGQSS